MSTPHKVVVTGLGLHTALGSTALTTWQNIKAGKSAIALRQPFLDLAPIPLAMAGKHPLSLDAITRAVVKEAWQDAGLEGGRGDGDINTTATPTGNDLIGLGHDCGVVIGSSRSHLREWEAMAISQRQSPGKVSGDWLGALPHGPARLTAQLVGAGGPVLAPMAACATGVWAIAQAADLIRSGHCSRVVAGAVESPITPLTIAGFRKMGALATTGCYPFDTEREGFVLGEGGAVMILESADLAAARGANSYGEVLAVGITNDSHHVSSFDPSYAMGQRALAQCLEGSELGPQDIDAVHVHGTSTAQNDRMEASLIEQMLRPKVPVMATKGATGHTLGASGALIVGLSLLSLREQAVLPCVGLRTAAFGLNFVQAGAAASLRKPLRKVLCFSFGFGGQNAVLALGKHD
ncbi:MAG: beta-ketoacyl-ACP synthase [Cyanobacteria bacterium P01_F01_bin.53]